MTQDRFGRALAALFAPVLHRLAFVASWPATVRAQNTDGTLELQPDNPRLPALKNVPIRLGIPGAKVKVGAGARVRVTWDEGDPRKPAATLWDDSSVIELDFSAINIVLNAGTHAVGRVGDAVQVTIPATTLITPTAPAAGNPITVASDITVTGTITAGAPGVKA